MPDRFDQEEREAFERVFGSAVAKTYRLHIDDFLGREEVETAFNDVEDELNNLAEAFIADGLLHATYSPLTGVYRALHAAFASGFYYGDPLEAAQELGDRETTRARMKDLEADGQIAAAYRQTKEALADAWQDIDRLRRRTTPTGAG